MKSGLLIGAILLRVVTGTSVAAAPISEEECVRLLETDVEGTSLRDAAIRTTEADLLRRPAASRRRLTADLVIKTLSVSAADPAVSMCSVLVAEAVDAPVLLTGYYRPLVPARRSRDAEFRYPLYALPPTTLRGLSRAEIDAGGLDGRVPAVAWLADPIEVFFVHVQGSALLELPDGTMAVGYAGSNGRSYTSIGSVLVRAGKMRQDDVSMESLKQFLRAHPSERDEILRANERYIYFRETDPRPVGSLGVPLTGGRSVAADPAVYPPGTLLFLRSVDGPRGVPPRLVFVQDRGSAIVGTGRLDLFIGTGERAASLAGPLRQQVEVYVLSAK